MLDRNAIIVLCVAVLTVFIGGAVVWLFISLKRLRGELSESSVSSLAALRKDNDRTRELTLKLGASLTELREGLSDTAARLAEAEKDLQDIADRLNEVESQDPDAKMYSRAVKMAQHGAPLAEIIDECEIKEAEAQLIYKMYAPKGRQ
ncbi:MAG: DUF2802 domain-containing protein [Succinivibrionaceae bacterium]|jgi:septal ring factor EnvC (AmiA/AmiB activator)|nr:DUF2802 domain-containing protein [Succinivibrionaceae bacterium]MCI6200059.1 DUF2802 domain-containing protein [Pseudomonadota bacterium]MDD6545237.1 DUF2802 domain-containing protein [Pseudomonadota bacterium]MDY3145882.1 DUF2802 domain-containing protein [Succinivibrionaceae bacterium]MDY6336709.1 DUF2802 domain-containing protein [Succinivibrionaceae bacterium]